MTTAAALVLVTLMSSSPERTGIPLENPLNWWLYILETATDELLPGTLPSPAEGELLSEGVRIDGFEGPSWLMAETGLREQGPLRIGSFGISAHGSVAGEVLTFGDAVETRAGVTGAFRVDLLDDLFMEERVSLWTGSDELPPDHFSPYHDGVEKGRHLYVDCGYLQWDPSPVTLAFGRIPQRWGPGRFTQLLISDNSPPMDMMRFSVHLGDILTFTGLTSTINSDSAVYLTAHRVDLKLRSNLRLGINESILYTASGLDFAYMNPFIPWYPVQWNERVDDNAFLSFDAVWKPIQGLEAYGELLIDDIQYESIGNRPDKLGWTLGLTGSLARAGLGGVLEYTRIDRYVYSQRLPRNFYLHHGAIIGSAMGPDADRVTLSVGTAAAWPLLIRVGADHTRHGEGTVEEGWPDSVTAGGAFPSGVIQYTTGADIRLSWYPLPILEAHGGVRNEWVRNRDHQHGESGSDLSSSLELIFKW